MNPNKTVEPVVSIRVVTADYYMSSPIAGLDIGYSTYRGLEIKKVPVIRIFGSTSTGYKVCLHVHGIFPYLYIPYDGSLPPEQMGHQIVMALDKAINILQGQGTSSMHHVFKTVLVSGVPIYGYHAKEHQFFKVYFYNPITRKHSYDLLLNGAVLKKILQPCEAHIPFILQFFMDFNLQGMNFIHLKNAVARRKPDGVAILESSKANPVSTCEMELDCFAGDILNSLEVQDGVQMNPGLAALWEEETERRKIKNMNLDTINPPPSQPRPHAEPTSSHTFYMANLRKRLRDCALEMGDVSMSFCEVNEQLETSLAIEVPDEAERKLLSASSIVLHVPGERRQLIPEEESDELLDILCELADEHESFVDTPSTATDTEDRTAGSQNSKVSRMTVTTPLLNTVSSCETVEDLPFDEDSILGTQCSRASRDGVAPVVSSDLASDESDEERETLEMSQIFDDSEHAHEMLEYNKKTTTRFGPFTSLVQITEQDEDTSSDSSYTESYLPNVDGADDDSSDDERVSDSGATKKARKYKPLLFRPSSRAVVKANIEARTTLQLTSPASSPLHFRDGAGTTSVSQKRMPRLSHLLMNDTQMERSESDIVPYRPASAVDIKAKPQLKQINDEYTDALFAMSYLSPLQAAAPESPPQPGTPLKDARITINNLLKDISAHEITCGRKVTIRTTRVLLKSLEEEVDSYQSQTRLKLRLPSSLSSQEKSVQQPRFGKRQSEKKSDNHDEEKKRKADKVRTPFIRGETEGDKSSLIDEEICVDCSSGRKSLVLEEETKINDLEIRSYDSKERAEKREVNDNCFETRGQPMEITHVCLEKENQVVVAETEIIQQEIIKEMITSDQARQREENSVFSVEEITENKNESKKVSIKDKVSDHVIEFPPNSALVLREITDLQLSNDGIASERGSLSESIPSWLGSSHSLSQNPSRSSSTLHFLWNDSSNSVWNNGNSLPEDHINTEEKTSVDPQSLIVPPQVFRPSTVYANLVDGPTRQHVISTMELYNISPADNGAPFWGDPKDLLFGTKSKDYGRITVPISSNLVRNLPDFGSVQQQIGEEICNEASSPVVLTTLIDPPSRQSILKWLETRKDSQIASSDSARSPRKGSEKPKKAKKRNEAGDRSQLEAPSLNNSFGFRASFGNCLEAKAVHQNQYLTILSLEIYVETRLNLHPDPEFDAVMALFYTITNDVPLESQIPDIVTGIIFVNQDCSDSLEAGQKNRFFSRAGIVDVRALSVDNEVALFQQFVLLVSTWNPDILVGYEIEMVSLGYLLQRSTILGIPLHNLLSRIPENVPDRPVANTEDIIEGGYMVEKNSDINIPGRIVLNLWRILRVEIALQSYTFENMLFHILHRRVPTYTFEKLTAWWKSNHDRWQVVEHYITRVRGNVELMEQLDVIGRTSELARLFGIQFYEVFTRGSQFRVESMMLRLAKPKNFVAASPSVTQRSRMKAPEWLPLILEPESKFYTDPVLVLDFQSLYPSMIIAYNYCYSTCLGRTHLVGKNEPFEFGCTQLLIPPAVAQQLVKQNLVNISPAGVVFVKPEVRRGIIPQMLSEILDTRIMVKQSMKEYEGDNTLRRVFDSRQLGLKLIANVTYGYTSANFSGRMPCVELGDSVVSKGRETLERAIHLIEERPEWKARVVYGDTDSVFVLLAGRSRQEAFEIGDQIANAVTEINPQPVKLKFEKVYQPCILQTKKRYVGYKYESAKQKEPVYEAKGIETVRRDGCPAVVKILERSLRVLFESYDVSKVKAYVERQFSKILQNRNSLQDFIFAKEFRGRQGYKPGACVPALEIAKQQVRIDRRSEPRIGERVPYIVTYGSPGVPLIRLVVPSNQLLVDTFLRLNGHYYITRAIIPALQRCFGLLGVDVLSWYQNLPRVAAAPNSVGPSSEHGNARKATISQYFGSSLCLLCDEPISANGLCSICGDNRQASSFSLAAMQRLRERDYRQLISLCQSCTGNIRIEQDCVSMDCPVLYRRVKAFQHLQLVSKWHNALSML